MTAGTNTRRFYFGGWLLAILRVDIETFSRIDLKKCGLYKYAEDDSTELLSAVYRWDESKEVTLWIPLKTVPGKCATALKEGIADLKAKGFIVKVVCQTHVPQEVREHIERKGIVSAFNAPFERVVLNGTAGKRVGWPTMAIEQMRCTAVKARCASMPGGLGDACNAMGTYPKSEAGHLVMLQLARPRKPSKEDPSDRWTIARVPEKYAQLYLYNIDDVLAESDLDTHLPSVSDDEWENWFMDQEMNDRGVAADLPAVDDFLYLIDQRKKELEARCIEVTKFKPTQREQIANWIRANGYPQLLDLQADTVRHIVELDTKCPDAVKEILTIYSTYGMKAVAKYNTILNAVCKDGRLHGMFEFVGAGTTGRWSSKLVQLQNLFRPVIDDCDEAFEAVSIRDLQWIKDLWPEEPMKVFASCIRGALCAAPGTRLMAIDYSGIESRFGAWVFDEHWKIKVFRDYDTILGYENGKAIRKGYDNYVMAYSELFGIPPEEVQKWQRQQAKPIELALLYEGGVHSFVTMAANYNVDLKELADSVWSSLDREALDSAEWMWDKYGKASGMDRKIYLACDSIKWMWRHKHPHVVQGWKDLKAAAIAAVENPGEVFAIPNKKVMFKIIDRWLVMLLPSGRKIRYFEPRVSGEGRDRQMTYMGVDTDTRRWMRTSIYGGAQANHVCQGGSSDFIRYGMRELRREGYPLVMTVHDEVVMECGEPFHDFKTAQKIYTRKQAWARDFPLACEGFEAQRFRK